MKIHDDKRKFSIINLILVLTGLVFINTGLYGRIFDEFQYRSSYWKPGWHGFITITNFDGKGNPPITLISEKWPESIHLIRYGIPFDLPEEPDEILYTEHEAKESISVPLSPKTTEIFLLISADFPDKIPLFDPSEKFMRRTVLDDPEQVYIEVIYSDGSSECFIPANVRKPAFGIEIGLGLYVVHPNKDKKPINLVLHDKMRTGAFGIWAVTLNTRKPITDESEQPFKWYLPAAKTPSPAPMSVRFNLSNGVAWDNIESKVWGGKITFTNLPVFIVSLQTDNLKKSRVFDSRDFSITDFKQDSNSCRIYLSLEKEKISLSGIFSFIKNNPDEILLDLKFYNAGKTPIVANIKFPVLAGIQFRDWDDTWYFSPAYNGIVNNVNFRIKSEFGEEHPMQFDGFFSAKMVGGFMISTRDTLFLPRTYHLGKTNNGCFYSIEYANQVLQPSDIWFSAPVVLTPVAGDWKDQFLKYCSWIKDFKFSDSFSSSWLDKAFVMISCNAEENKNLIETLNKAFDKFALCDAVMISSGFNKDLEIINKSSHSNEFRQTFESRDISRRFVEALLNNRSNAAIQESKTYIIPTNYLRKLIILEQELNLVTNVVSRLKKSGIPFGIKLTESLLLPLKFNGLTSPQIEYQFALEHLLFLKECYLNVNKNLLPDFISIQNPWSLSTFYGKDYYDNRINNTEFLKIIKTNIGEKTKLIANVVPVDTFSGYFGSGFTCLLPYYNSNYGKTFQNFMNYYKFRESIAPHYVNLYRFAFPQFKLFNIAAPFSKEYWNIIKYAFFNGEAICLDESAIELMDESDVETLQKIYKIYHKFQNAFSSTKIEPLVPTMLPGLFANRFSAEEYSLWTLYNTNYQQVKGNLISVEHKQGMRYFDLLNDREIPFKTVGKNAVLSFSIMPRSLACIVQLRK